MKLGMDVWVRWEWGRDRKVDGRFLGRGGSLNGSGFRGLGAGGLGGQGHLVFKSSLVFFIFLM